MILNALNRRNEGIQVWSKIEPRTRQMCRARKIILFKFPSVGNFNHLELKYRGKFAALSSRTRTAAHTREGAQGVERGRQKKQTPCKTVARGVGMLSDFVLLETPCTWVCPQVLGTAISFHPILTRRGETKDRQIPRHESHSIWHDARFRHIHPLHRA